MSVKESAAARIRVEAANFREAASELRVIREFGQAQRLEAVAEQLDLAAKLLTEHGKKPKKAARTTKLVVGDTVVTNKNSGAYGPGLTFVVTQVVPKQGYPEGGAFFVMGDPKQYGLWENHVDIVKEAE